MKTLFIVWLSFLFAITATAQEPLFDSTSSNPRIRFIYPSTASNPYLDTLRQWYTSGASSTQTSATELFAVLNVMHWTNSLWKHNGNNEPSAGDALTIIREAGQGKNFRCVEYARVLTDVLLALGYKARVLALKTKGAEQSTGGAGHVLIEVWLPNHGKWVLADAQFNAVPFADTRPLNAVELMQALHQKRPVVFQNKNGPLSDGEATRYRWFIFSYLYFFDVEFDQRMIPYRDKWKVDTFSSLMLGPLGVAKPAFFQRRFPLNYMLYTHAVADFYRKPQ